MSAVRPKEACSNQLLSTVILKCSSGEEDWFNCRASVLLKGGTVRKRLNFALGDLLLCPPSRCELRLSFKQSHTREDSRTLSLQHSNDTPRYKPWKNQETCAIMFLTTALFVVVKS